MKLILALAFIVATQAEPLYTGTIAFATTLKCGQCIAGGYTFCVKGLDQQSPYQTANVETICADPDLSYPSYPVSQQSDKWWSCSDAYSSKDYALTMCPTPRDKCTDNKYLEYVAENLTNSLTPTNMLAGEVCVYKMTAICAPPYVGITGTASATGFYVSYLEWDRRTYGETFASNQGTAVQNRKGMSFHKGGAPRFMKFNAGTNDFGQQRPARIDWADNLGYMTKLSHSRLPYYGVQQTKNAVARAIEWLLNFHDWGVPVVGWGTPTVGKYDLLAKGYHAFGSTGQGPETKGLKENSTPYCVDRDMYVAILAKVDQTETVTVELGTSYWDQPYDYATQGAVNLRVGAAIIALLSFVY